MQVHEDDEIVLGRPFEELLQSVIELPIDGTRLLGHGRALEALEVGVVRGDVFHEAVLDPVGRHVDHHTEVPFGRVEQVFERLLAPGRDVGALL